MTELTTISQIFHSLLLPERFVVWYNSSFPSSNFDFETLVCDYGDDEVEFVFQDLDLPPIMEEDEIKSVPVNEERAIVLYKPLHHYHQPSNEHLFVDRDFISGFKSKFFCIRSLRLCGL